MRSFTFCIGGFKNRGRENRRKGDGRQGKAKDRKQKTGRPVKLAKYGEYFLYKMFFFTCLEPFFAGKKNLFAVPFFIRNLEAVLYHKLVLGTH